MLIGLLGLKGSGKDTAAAMLAELAFKRMAFADALYAEVARAYEVTPHFLGRRDSKETPLERLALEHCRDTRFIGLFIKEEDRAGRSIEEIMVAPWSPRCLLQQWGTEYRRRSPWGHDEYWVAPLMRKIDAMPPGSRVVLTDVRDALEVQSIRDRGGALVRIRRRKIEDDDAFAVAAGLSSALHSSEMLARTCKVDFEIENIEGNPGAMRGKLETFVTRLKTAA